MSIGRTGTAGAPRDAAPALQTPAPAAAAPPPPATRTADTPVVTPAPPADAAAPSREALEASRTAAAGSASTAAALWGARFASGMVAPLGAAAVTTPAAGPPPLPAGTHDVGQMTPAALGAMKKSTDPAQRRLAETIGRAQVAYADDIRRGARVLAGNSAGNGGKPVLTLVPPGFDPSRPARVHTHYHGFNATVADPMGHGSGTTARMREIQQRDSQAVFVLPECGNARAGAYATDWSNVRSQADTTRDALTGAGITQVGTSIVSAHSGGGAALAAALRAHPDGSGLQADRLELQDCFYGSEHAVAAWGRTANGQAARSVVYLHGTNDLAAHSPAAVQRVFGDRYQQVEMGAQPRINRTNNPELTDENGQVLRRNGQPLRKYAPDAHNRTVGEFMDSVPGP